jgi:hypothetical protein
MKSVLAGLLILLFLSGCSTTARLKEGCSEDGEVCIEVGANESILMNEPITLTITITSVKEIPGLGIFLYSSPKILFEDVQGWEEGGINWVVDLKPNQALTITRKAILPPEEGIYQIFADAYTPQLRAVDYFYIHLTKEGGTVYLSRTSIPITEGPLPLMDPIQRKTAEAIPTDTPWPTLTAVGTTETPPQVILGTPAYPPPPTPYP